MKLILSKDIIGIRRDTKEECLHAKAGDTLQVISKESNYYMCISPRNIYEYIPIFTSNVKQEIIEDDLFGDEENNVPGSIDFFYTD